jgi:hypothetical protein
VKKAKETREQAAKDKKKIMVESNSQAQLFKNFFEQQHILKKIE